MPILVITFDEAVDAETGNITIKKASDDSTVETIDVTGSKVTGSGTTQIVINPSATFNELTNYYVLVDATAFDDVNSNSFAGISSASTWNFTTRAEPTETPPSSGNTILGSAGPGAVSFAPSVFSPLAPPPTPSNPSSSAPSSSTSFTRNLTVNSTGNDVLALQKYLNAQGFTLASSGPGSPGNETTTFGPRTYTALIKFQKARNITPPAGFFGPITRGVVGEEK
jgi:hypothetical protein